MVVGLTLPLAILVEGHPVQRTKYHPLPVAEVYFLQSKARTADGIPIGSIFGPNKKATQQRKLMSTAPTDDQMSGFAMYLLHAGILASAIPDRLMVEYSLTSEKAGELAAVAIARHKRDTKLFDKPG